MKLSNYWEVVLQSVYGYIMICFLIVFSLTLMNLGLSTKKRIRFTFTQNLYDACLK